MRAWVIFLGMMAGSNLAAQELPTELRAKVDAAIKDGVAKTGVPSASVGIVLDGRIVYTELYIQPGAQTTMTAATAYPVGSISKQFTAACILALEQDGKLTLDDTVSRWFPQLTRAKEITLREVLSHTSGYEDYAPQDYTIPAWMKPVDPAKVVAEWAGKPLDFEPGTAWQYSNTNFMLAALIVEKASGMRYIDFLRQRVLKPAGLAHVLDLDAERDQLQVQGYERRALAALRPAVLEAPGWYFGDGSLAMPVADLLAWDISLMNRTVLTAKSYEEMETAVKLKDGSPTTYGLGIQVMEQGGHRVLEHSGEVGGYTSENVVLPDEKLAIAVLTNQEASDAAEEIAGAIAKLVLEKHGVATTVTVMRPEETQLRGIMTGLQDGKIDRRLFTADANFYFSAETLGDFASSLKPLGAVTKVEETQEELRGGMVGRTFNVGFAGGRSVKISTYTMKDGRLEQLLVEGEN